MKELSKKKLKEKLDIWFQGYENNMEEYGCEDEINYKEHNQAIKQFHKLIEEKPKVTEEFVEKWHDKLWGFKSEDCGDPDAERFALISWEYSHSILKQMLTEAGIEVEK